MRCSLAIAATVALAAALVGGASAAPKPGGPKPGNVARRPAIAPQSGVHAGNKAKPGRADHRHDARRDDHGHHRPIPGRYYIYGYDNFYFGYTPFYDGVVLPPLYVPADPWFGPWATQRFWDGFYYGNSNRGQPDYSAPDYSEEGIDLRRDIEANPPAPRKNAEAPLNARANALAWKFIGYGDALFAQQKFAEANNRYRKASRSAAQLADAWFRQAFALSAIQRYDLAVAAMKRGLKLDPRWPRSDDFDLGDLFADNEPAKNVYMDALVDASVEKPNDADLLFMVGVHLYFDGQTDDADKLFERAKRLAGHDTGHIEAFLMHE